MTGKITPETDAAQHEGLLRGNPMPTQVVHVNFARKLERERDEVRKDLQEIKEYGTEEINAAVSLRQKLAQALVDLDNLQDQRDLAMKVIKRLEQERDEAITRRMETIMQCELYEQERDEAREERNKLTSLNESYAACWDEIKDALHESEQGDKTCDLDRVLKAIRERDEARAERDILRLNSLGTIQLNIPVTTDWKEEAK